MSQGSKSFSLFPQIQPGMEMVTASCISGPPNDYVKKSSVESGNRFNVPKGLFDSLSYFVLWYDRTYPYGEYTGYQQYLPELLKGVPVKVENTYSEALRCLNKSSSSTQYILILTGNKKKKLVHEVHNNANIRQIFVIKPFPDKVNKWSCRYSKLAVLKDFKQLVEKLKVFADTYTPNKFQYGVKERLVNYKVDPDLMTMSQQSVTALLDEMAQSEEQGYYKMQYEMVLRKFKEHVKKREEKERYSTSYFSSERFWKYWIYLLEVAEYFNECPFIVPGASIEELESLNVDDNQLFIALEAMSLAIKTKNEIDFKGYNKCLKELHAALYRAIVKYHRKNSIIKGGPLYLTRMLLQDIDVCLKVYLYVSFKLQANCESLAQEFLHAAIVGDNRVSVLFELWEAWEDRDYRSELYIEESRLNTVLRQIAVKNAVMLNLGKTLGPVYSFVKKSCMLREYFIFRDFRTDFDTLAKLRYSFTYFIIEPSLSVSEYNQLIDTCIQNAITPLFVLYLPSNTMKIAKEMLKPRWIVSFAYCRTPSEVLDYLRQNETNLNRDFAQYSKYYDDFKATLANSRQLVPPPRKLQDSEADGGWEMLSSIDQSVFNQLVSESALGTRLTGSLHYYFLKALKSQNAEDIYWANYPHLLGVTNKYVTVPDINCAKCLLRAYTLQTAPAFYKMMNDAFRAGTEESVAEYRAFFSIMHDLVKKGALRKHIGFVYRGTYFSEATLGQMIEGKTIYSTCFTSTSKSESVAREYARKTKRNVLLEIELDPHADTNVNIHAEECSRYPEEQEVLLLPFSNFLIKRIFKEDNITIVSLKEVVPEYEVISIKGIEYGN
eukprot:TRINITY_DN3035_c0_g1_i2.p1 TRINITY_DN3035_c0_g1~~TRINITY_DN3035_c0_g1_i2.p1  ORF type:complete len:833 (+),score=208.09 TRINITY_DN3035_c0_g1_i2:334-2832(+)